MKKRPTHRECLPASEKYCDDKALSTQLIEHFFYIFHCRLFNECRQYFFILSISFHLLPSSEAHVNFASMNMIPSFRLFSSSTKFSEWIIPIINVGTYFEQNEPWTSKRYFVNERINFAKFFFPENIRENNNYTFKVNHIHHSYTWISLPGFIRNI